MNDGGVTVPIAANELAGYEESSSSDSIHQPGNRDSKARIDLPPPPPLQERQAQIAHHEGSPVRGGDDSGRSWLLPPKKKEFTGKKCLVLDLDETLVHSSFKVWPVQHGSGSSYSWSLDSTPSRLYNPSGDRWPVS